jgi:hypothetical protein
MLNFISLAMGIPILVVGIPVLLICWLLWRLARRKK